MALAFAGNRCAATVFRVARRFSRTVWVTMGDDGYPKYFRPHRDDLRDRRAPRSGVLTLNVPMRNIEGATTEKEISIDLELTSRAKASYAKRANAGRFGAFT
ncbi:hypothetical protein HUU61_10790 [Rhodopseudomonas palustris]|nr:hypothetical protein [Rhodopseudomonas palustris]